MSFPDNPTDKMIFESSPGIFYQYNVLTKGWYRISMPSIPMATSFRDGLMSSDDFNKLTGLIVPPPQISITTEDCPDIVYNSGLLALEGDDEGIIKVNVHSENLHENTGVVDFKVDTERLAQKLIALGKFRITAPQGDQGEQGPQGDPGANALPVGPQGADGARGKNAPWLGTLSEETFDVAQQGRAIVDIGVRKVSADENYIVVRRANIGNPEACPDTIIPQDVQSPWVLAFSTGPGDTVITQVLSQSGKVCGWACNSSLYYFDIEAIIQGIHNQWLDYIQALKISKEQIAKDWLNVMMPQFNDQKAALCCALEACKSRSRNVDARRYIESQSVAAAVGGYNLIIGKDSDKVVPPGTNCEYNITPTNYNFVHLSDPDCVVNWSSLCPQFPPPFVPPGTPSSSAAASPVVSSPVGSPATASSSSSSVSPIPVGLPSGTVAPLISGDVACELSADTQYIEHDYQLISRDLTIKIWDENAPCYNATVDLCYLHDSRMVRLVSGYQLKPFAEAQPIVIPAPWEHTNNYGTAIVVHNCSFPSTYQGCANFKMQLSTTNAGIMNLVLCGSNSPKTHRISLTRAT